MAEKMIRGISCPSCGGSLEISEGTVLLSCNSCGTGLLVKGDRGISSFYVPLKYSKEAILAKVQNWFQGLNKAFDLKESAKFTEVFPVYLPFWRVNAWVVGWVLGEVKRDKTYKHVERRVFQKYEFTCPACDVGEFGVKWVDLRGDEILPFELEAVQRQGMTFGVMNTSTDVLQDCEEKFMKWAESSAGVERTSMRKLHLINRSLGIVFYPLWIVRYQHKNRIYQITADAESGDLLYGRAPGNTLYRVACLLGSVMAGDFVLTTYLRSSSRDSDDFIGVAFLCLILMFFGFRKFRYGAEVKIEQKDKGGSRISNILQELRLPRLQLDSILRKS